MITLEDVGKAYRKRGEIHWALRHMTGSLPAGQHIGILGAEGQGKTTLVNLLTGRDKPNEGKITRIGQVSFPFADRTTFANSLTGLQNLRFLTDIFGRDFREVSEFVADFSELGRKMDQPLTQYSNDQRFRLTVGILFGMDFDYIVVDGQLGVGDVPFRRKITNFVQENSGRFTLVQVTTNAKLVSRLCEAGGVLHNGRLTLYDSMEEAAEVFGEITVAVA